MTRVIRSSAFTLALGYVLLGIGALVLFAAPLWYAWQVTIQDGRTEILREDAQRLSVIFERGGAQGLTAFINSRVGLQIAGERILLLTDSALHPLAGNLLVWPSAIPSTPGTYTVPISMSGTSTPAVFVHSVLPGDYHLLVGRDLARFAPLETHFWVGLAGAVSVLIVVGVLGGVVIRRTLLDRVQSMGQTVTAIMRGDLSHRLATRPGGDELELLSGTINRMLDQIELLVRGVRNVSNAIAHDLRTPLAELRSRLEELVVTRPPEDETFMEVEGAVADVDRVIRIFNALLRLAEIDSGLRRSGFVQLDTAQIAAEAVEFYLPAAELKGITLLSQNDAPVPLFGDAVLLAQAIGNLIDNALKYAPHNGSVTVATRLCDNGMAEIAVADNGPGVPDEEKPKVVERFYRGDTSRGTPGVGLGLSLVAAVAKLHSGNLELADNHPGLRASMVVKQT